MSDERRRILDLLAQGKLSVSDAERLLQALGEAPAAPEAEAGRVASGAAPKHLHVHIRRNSAWAPGWEGRWWARKHGFAGACAGDAKGQPTVDQRIGRDVDVRIPLSLLRSGMKLAAFLPGRAADVLSAHLKEHGLDADLSRLDASQLEEILRNMGEIAVDLDGGRGQVRISCE